MRVNFKAYRKHSKLSQHWFYLNLFLQPLGQKGQSMATFEPKQTIQVFQYLDEQFTDAIEYLQALNQNHFNLIFLETHSGQTWRPFMSPVFIYFF